MSRCAMYTVGHSTRLFEAFVDLLRAWHVDCLIDVRSAPGSRRNPQFNADSLALQLPAAGIAYERIAELGGWRRPRTDSVNTGWHNASFRGYADYMQTDAFRGALDALIQRAGGHVIAFMCAEAVPWRCHRSLISDALTARGCEVRHITSATRAERHRITPFARMDGTRVTYPAML